MSVGDKEALGHPHAHSLAATVVTLGGPLLFLVGTMLFRRVLEQRWARAHVLGVSRHPGARRLRPLLDALGESVAVALLLVAVAIGETVGRLRRGRRSGG